MTAETEAPAWLDELDLHVGAPDAVMGTRALNLDDWFVVDDEWEAQRSQAQRLLADERDEVLVGSDLPGAAGPSSELLALLRRRFGSGGSGPGEQDPLAAARLLVADDLCLLVPEGDRWVLAAGAVCFPSYWRPSDKVGLPLGDVHGPVPGYPGALADRVDRFLGRLPPGRGVWRRNWLLHDVPDLHLPTAPAPRPDRPPAPDGRWLRSERQALVRLPRHEAVVFSIRTQQVPLRALASRPDVCAGLAAALRGWSAAQLAYKGRAVDGTLLGWLDEAAG